MQSQKQQILEDAKEIYKITLMECDWEAGHAYQMTIGDLIDKYGLSYQEAKEIVDIVEGKEEEVCQ